jgi:ethanolamine utilization protein EutA
LINQRLGDALIAAAEDPCFESWLAFMGNCAGLSREYPNRPIINLDIGGGTTNIALGKGGEVLRTGSLFVGARHVQVVPGTYRIARLSHYAQRLFDELAIRKSANDSLTPCEVQRIVDFYVTLLTAAVSGNSELFQRPVVRLHQQAAFRLPPHEAESVADLTVGVRQMHQAERAIHDRAILTLSGGVGELVYSHRCGRPWPTTTYYGDLGIDLAQRLVAQSAWADHFRRYVPAGGGRATVYGLLRHSTQVSGNTLFLPNPEVLPIRNMPIFGSILPASTEVEIQDYLDLAARSGSGGCLLVKLGAANVPVVQGLGKRIAAVIARNGFRTRQPLVLVVDQNVGKMLGHCVTEWGRVPINLVVVDEIDVRDAQFVQLGKLHNQIVPVSFFGVRES